MGHSPQAVTDDNVFRNFSILGVNRGQDTATAMMIDAVAPNLSIYAVE